MLIKVPQSSFYNALQTVQRGTASQSTLPILTGIKIEADQKDRVLLCSTDLEISMMVNCEASVEKKGSTVVTGRLVVDILKYLPDGTVELKLENEGKQLHLSSGKASFKVQTMAVEDFPVFPETQGDAGISIECKKLQEIIKQTSKAISRDETRPVLTGALIKVEKNSLLVVATDSYRLAYKAEKISNSKKLKMEVLVPYKAVEEIAKLISSAEEALLSTDNNLLKVETPGGTMITRLIEGQFPNYDQLIPKEAKMEVLVKKEEFIGAVNQASLMAQKNMSIKIQVTEGELKISAATAGIGEAHTSVKAKTSGELVDEMAFNAQYLVDGINSAPGEDVLIQFNGLINPGLIKSTVDENYMYLVMPIRIS